MLAKIKEGQVGQDPANGVIMEFEQIVNKRLKGMAVRILSRIEDALDADLEDVGEDDSFKINGHELKAVRSEILNAAGETSRSIASLKSKEDPGRLSFDRGVISALNRSEVDIAIDEDSGIKMPVFETSGEFNLLRKIRDEIGAGVVYNKKYICRGVDDMVALVIPFLDSASVAGIKIAGGNYKSWRSDVCVLYLDGLEDE